MSSSQPVLPGRPGSMDQLKNPISVAVYDQYEDAQRAVDYLADSKFPVENLAIVGTDLKSMERVTGSLNWGKVLAAALLNSLLWAIGFAFLMSVLFRSPLLSSFLWALVVFALFNLVTTAASYGMSRGQRDFTSKTRIVATHYEILGEREVANHARAILSGNQVDYPTRELAGPAPSTPNIETGVSQPQPSGPQQVFQPQPGHSQAGQQPQPDQPQPQQEPSQTGSYGQFSGGAIGPTDGLGEAPQQWAPPQDKPR